MSSEDTTRGGESSPSIQEQMRPHGCPAPRRVGNARQYRALFRRARDCVIAHRHVRATRVDPPTRPTSPRRPVAAREVPQAPIITDVVSGDDDEPM